MKTRKRFLFKSASVSRITAPFAQSNDKDVAFGHFWLSRTSGSIARRIESHTLATIARSCHTLQVPATHPQAICHIYQPSKACPVALYARIPTLLAMNFPLELINLVLFNVPLDGRIATLKQTTLVCRDWLYLARRQLFSSKRFSCATEFDTSLQVLQSAPKTADCITSVALNMDSKNWKPWLETFGEIFSSLRHVRCLEIEAIPGDFDEDAYRIFTDCLDPILKSAEIIHLFCIMFSDELLLRRLITSFSRIKSFAAFAIGISDAYGEVETSAALICPGLVHVNIADSDDRAYSTIITLAPNARRLHLSETCMFYKGLDPNLILLGIEELGLSVKDCSSLDTCMFDRLTLTDTQSSFPDQHPLTTLTPNLKTFKVSIDDFCPDDIAFLIFHLPSTVTQIHIEVACSPERALDLDFSILAFAIDYTNLPALEVVELEFTACSGSPDHLINEARLSVLRQFQTSRFAEEGLLCATYL